MKHGYIKHSLQPCLNLKALRRFNVLKINASEGRGYLCTYLDQLFRVFLIYLDIKHIHIGENLEKETFALHHRLTRQRTYVTQTCLLYTSPRPRDGLLSRMPASAC